MSARVDVIGIASLFPLTGRGTGGQPSHAAGVRVLVNLLEGRA